eukprot:10421257-Alexandrium_andersonii.AAC.1
MVASWLQLGQRRRGWQHHQAGCIVRAPIVRGHVRSRPSSGAFLLAVLRALFVLIAGSLQFGVRREGTPRELFFGFGPAGFRTGDEALVATCLLSRAVGEMYQMAYAPRLWPGTSYKQ